MGSPREKAVGSPSKQAWKKRQESKAKVLSPTALREVFHNDPGPTMASSSLSFYKPGLSADLATARKNWFMGAYLKKMPQSVCSKVESSPRRHGSTNSIDKVFFKAIKLMVYGEYLARCDDYPLTRKNYRYYLIAEYTFWGVFPEAFWVRC
jgi:hypothetical protein